MNFKRFNGSTWETVQHKIYGSGTDSLTAFPAQIQASGETLTDYLISGNTVQDGTPTPEAPVDVVGCGDWDETHQSYKLTPTVTGTEYPIYLGQVETTRRIKKLVLTGEENPSVANSTTEEGTKVFSFRFNDIGMTDILGYDKKMSSISYPFFYSSHFKQKNNTGEYTDIKNGEVGANSIGEKTFNRYIIFASSVYTTEASFRLFLAQQYAAGTPVTVWYVLAEPETGIVNEPLHKIGDYADTITMAQAGVTIPTFDGDNIISFGTAVQPSAMSAAFKGWHPVQGAKQYDGSEWR